jgi:hypothetical protein
MPVAVAEQVSAVADGLPVHAYCGSDGADAVVTALMLAAP